MKIKCLAAGIMAIFMSAAVLCSCSSNPNAAPSAVADNSQTPAVVESSREENANDDVLKVGFVYNGTAGDGGWTYSHDQGRIYLEEKLPYIESVIVDNVPEGGGDVDRVMEQMIQQGCKVIMATGFGYMDSVISLAAKHPDVYFLHCTGYKMADNVSIYDVREIEAQYLNGVIAGINTKVNKIGFVASQPIPAVVRAVNDFALGVKSVNPDATVNLIWTSTWYDPPKEKEAALSLLDTGVDVVAMYQDTPAVLQAAQERGALAIGYHSDMSAFAPQATVSSYLWNWGPTYVQEVEKYRNGTWKSEDLWPGMKDGACDISPINTSLVVDGTVDKVAQVRSQLMDGSLEVYAGPLNDNTGAERVPAGSTCSLEDLRGMNWLMDNIVGTLPE